MNSRVDTRAAQPVTRRVAWEHLASILRPWRGTLALVGLSVLLAKVLDLAPPLLIQRIVDNHLTPRQPAGLRMWAMLTFWVLELTRPIYSSINFGLFPAASIRFGDAMCVGMMTFPPLTHSTI